MIRTARLMLRPLRADDLDPLHAIFSDPRAMRYWDRPAWQDRDSTARLLDGFRRDAPSEHLEYAIERKGVCIGRVGMWRRYEVGYILHPDHWGQGYGTEALQALITDIWARFPEATALTAEVDPRNIASCRVLEKLGFVCSHVVEKNFDYGGIEWCDTAYFVLNAPR